jgi:hypothetical protein
MKKQRKVACDEPIGCELRVEQLSRIELGIRKVEKNNDTAFDSELIFTYFSFACELYFKGLFYLFLLKSRGKLQIKSQNVPMSFIFHVS